MDNGIVELLGAGTIGVVATAGFRYLRGRLKREDTLERRLFDRIAKVEGANDLLVKGKAELDREIGRLSAGLDACHEAHDACEKRCSRLEAALQQEREERLAAESPAMRKRRERVSSSPGVRAQPGPPAETVEEALDRVTRAHAKGADG